MNETTITLEQVEHLKRTADVSYDDAREALIQADGDLLEAMIWLERQGKTQGGVSSYSTREGQSAGPQVEQVAPLLHQRSAAGETAGGKPRLLAEAEAVAAGQPAGGLPSGVR